jgi:TatD DNase family protein
MIDSHCHLTDTRLSCQLRDVLARAAAAGVDRMVTIGTQPGDWEACIGLCGQHTHLRCAIGVHPNHCHQVEIEQVALLRGLQANPSVVALGEMGLDYHYEFAPRDRQRRFLEAQLALAVELHRPVVIHCREAIDDCLAVMKGYPVTAAVFHCFTGVVTYKNAPQLREIARSIPADRILIETDAPYLSPEPMRKIKTNEPSFVVHTAAAIAAARGVDVEEIDRLTTANALRFYRLNSDAGV